jgi:hypothetical protein
MQPRVADRSVGLSFPGAALSQMIAGPMGFAFLDMVPWYFGTIG